MTTITIQIGNSDDKLTQAEWSGYHSLVESEIKSMGFSIHFHGCSHGAEQWQNAAWVIAVEPPNRIEALRSALVEIRGRFRQDSIAWTEGHTLFI